MCGGSIVSYTSSGYRPLRNAGNAKNFRGGNKLQKMLDVEASLAWSHGKVGNIPHEDAERIVRMDSIDHVKLRRVKKIEREF